MEGRLADCPQPRARDAKTQVSATSMRRGELGSAPAYCTAIPPAFPRKQKKMAGWSDGGRHTQEGVRTCQRPSAGVKKMKGWVAGTCCAQRAGTLPCPQKSARRSQKRAAAPRPARRVSAALAGWGSGGSMLRTAARRPESMAATAARQTRSQTPAWMPVGGRASQMLGVARVGGGDPTPGERAEQRE